ncbi:Nn.00g020200.m01.CDS01 [Neocucurbitaria sp. VM-36]
MEQLIGRIKRSGLVSEWEEALVRELYGAMERETHLKDSPLLDIHAKFRKEKDVIRTFVEAVAFDICSRPDPGVSHYTYMEQQRFATQLCIVLGEMKEHVEQVTSAVRHYYNESAPTAHGRVQAAERFGRQVTHYVRLVHAVSQSMVLLVEKMSPAARFRDEEDRQRRDRLLYTRMLLVRGTLDTQCTRTDPLHGEHCRDVIDNMAILLNKGLERPFKLTKDRDAALHLVHRLVSCAQPLQDIIDDCNGSTAALAREIVDNPHDNFRRSTNLERIQDFMWTTRAAYQTWHHALVAYRELLRRPKTHVNA